ncbi:MAG TPA: 2,3,4,5-tetrahydropyridine-2,6-dicarboxylate N-acetyltransferase, partial [Fervidobacterium sp.]|nr:2,3,4,5-tetrahydropyridine-2,6-dicarboxylate N-acetyltransferase [Fervidobacterium sp.]
MTSEEIIEIIANSKKKDIVRAYVSGELEKIN